MNLKKGIDILAFMKRLGLCKGNVFFETPEDKIDLKSVLSQYVFVTIMNNPKLTSNGVITCEEEEDFVYLEPFLE